MICPDLIAILRYFFGSFARVCLPSEAVRTKLLEVAKEAGILLKQTYAKEAAQLSHNRRRADNLLCPTASTPPKGLWMHDRQKGATFSFVVFICACKSWGV
jgi:hypothetical protein